jgi:hypothetical protein
MTITIKLIIFGLCVFVAIIYFIIWLKNEFKEVKDKSEYDIYGYPTDKRIEKDELQHSKDSQIEEDVNTGRDNYVGEGIDPYRRQREYPLTPQECFKKPKEDIVTLAEGSNTPENREKLTKLSEVLDSVIKHKEKPPYPNAMDYYDDEDKFWRDIELYVAHLTSEERKNFETQYIKK